MASFAARITVNVIHLRLLGGVELATRDAAGEQRLVLAPKPLGLLAYLALAAAQGRSVRRDVLLALFWPELSSTRARAALRQALFQLRRGLGDGALETSHSVIALSKEGIVCDVVEFEQCIARGDRAAAIEHYRGSLLRGFFIDGASSELEEWIEQERARLAWKAYVACSELADDASRTRNGIAAAQWARMAVSLAPDNEIAIRRLIEILDTFGDRAGALRVADDFARWLSEEFGATPSAETLSLIAAVRARDLAGAAIERSPTRVSHPLIPPQIAVAPPSEPRRDREPMPRAPVSRTVLSPRRLLGAATLFVATAVGALIATRASHGAMPNGVGVASRTSPPITIASPVARRLYSEGTGRFFAGDWREASRLLVAALADDSSCAMCAYYAYLAYRGFDDADADRMLQVAMRLANRASEPERLLIHYGWADATNSVTRSIVAESLVTRYAYWPDAQMAAGEAAEMDGRWLVAAAHLRRAIAAQPVPDSAAGGLCSVCLAQLLLVQVDEAADSLPAALRVARGLVRVRPHSRLAWQALSHALAQSGRYAEARAAIDSSTLYASGRDDDVIDHALIEIRAGNFGLADRLLTTLAQTGNHNSKFDALWYLVISLRAQGRLHEALEIAVGQMRRSEPATTQGIGESELAEAQVRFELGQYRRAAEIFEHQAFPPDTFSRAAVGRIARQRVWTLTLAGSALAAADDSLALSALVDTVEWWGRKSGFGRDRQLYHYLRGLLWMVRARQDSAVVAFRSALLSETEGFSRINLELARALMALGRPREAIPLIEHPLSGTFEAGNFYVARTELQETLARVYDAAGERDSAVVYHRIVLRAWRRADAQYQPVIEQAQARLDTDERLLASPR